MKKKVIIPIIVGMLIIIAGIIIGLQKMNNNDNNKSLLVVRTYSNYAFPSQFNGTAIFDDGSVYGWNFKGSTDKEYKEYIGNNDINTKKGLEKFILKRGKKRPNNVPSKELEEIKRIVNNLTEEDTDYEVGCSAVDAGNFSTAAFKNKTRYEIKVSGACDGTSKTTNSSKLLAIANKYL